MKLVLAAAITFLTANLAVAGEQVDATCLAAAERIIGFLEAEAPADSEFARKLGTNREQAVMEQARKMSGQDKAACAMVLAMPDSSMRAFARATLTNQ